MRRTLRWNSLAGAALALALAPAFAPAAPSPSGPAPDKDNVSPVEKLRKDLDKTVTVRFDKDPLPAALDKLHAQAGVQFSLDANTIQQMMGETPDQLPPVEGEFKGAKVRDVLRAILAADNLGYAPVGDAVIVTTEDMAFSRQLHQHVSIGMDKVEFADAVRQIAKQMGVNLVVDPRVEKQAAAKVSLQVEDVPLDTAVRLLAEMAGLKPVRVGNVLFVTSKENANEMRNDPDIAQPNPNVQRQAEISNLQLQLAGQALVGNGLGVGIGAAAPGAAVPAVPPGVAPAVPPAADAPKDKDDDKKPADNPAK